MARGNAPLRNVGSNSKRNYAPAPSHRGQRPAPGRKKKKGGGVLGFLSLIFSIIVVGGALALVAAFAFIAEVNRPGPTAADTNFVAQHGASVGAIGTALQRQGLVRNGLMFRLASRFYGQGKTIQAGEYAIPPHATVVQIVQKMASGDVVTHGITIPEGLTSAQAMDIIARAPMLTGDMPPTPPEGSILPETYTVTSGMTRASLVEQMRTAQEHALAEIWAKRAPNLPISTPEEAVKLASIVERETGVATERPRVASVFTNRLRIHMALQSDPTIIYGVCVRAPSHCKNGRLVNERTGEIRTIRESEIAMNTGYNTYQIVGLPPTPISNPGRAALEAVVNPAQTDDLYFVADGSGGHVFAATVAEHNANVARWRQIERQRLAEEAAHARASGLTTTTTRRTSGH